MRKRLIFAFVLALCAALLCVGAWAAGETPSTTCAISNAEELKKFRDDVNNGDSFEGKTVVLTQDIDLEDSENNQWTPIGYSNGSDVLREFAGTFDGGGHTVSGLYINSEATYAGLFGVVGEDGTVKNLTVAGDITNKGKFTGGVIGYNLGAVENCAFTGKVNGGGGTGDSAGYEHGNYTGGVAGINYGTITNCRNSGAVTGNDSGTNTHSYTGGVAGENIGAVEDCCNTGAVTGSGSGSSYFTYAGGVAGDNMYDGDGSDSGTITNCRNSGTVIGNGGRSRTGGVAGGNCNDSPEPVATITNCYNTGNVTGTGSSSRTGGVAGENDSVVTNCYNTGTVNNSGDFGGVAGRNTLTVENCYYLTGEGYPDIGIGGSGALQTGTAALTAEEFKNPDSFTDWDFDTVWIISSVLGRPVLVDNREADGTAEAPYQIGTAGQLAAFRDKVNNGYTDDHAVLTADIDLYLAADNPWTPIGSGYKEGYTGTFDGDGHTIEGLYVSRDNYVGLFGYVDNGGTVKNLKVSGTVTGSGITAGLARPIGGVVALNAGTVENCAFTGKVNGPKYSISIYTGGVVGRNTGVIKNCSNTGAITGDYNNFSGGVAGFNDGGTIENCYNTGTVTSSNGYHTGGVAGYNQRGTIENCYNTGEITGSSTYIGSVMGRDLSGTVKNCYYLAVEGLTGIGGTEYITGTAEGKTEEDFESGAVANLLGDAYGQTLGEDDSPRLIALDPGVPRVYRVTFDFNDGDVTPDLVSYTNGTVTPPADPSAAGKTFAGWYTEDNRELGTFKIAADTTFTARFTEDAAGVDIPTAGIDIGQTEGGTVDTNLGNASEGSTITVTVTPDEGYEVGGVTVTGPDGEIPVERVDETTYTFTMPDGSVSIDVTFVPATGGFSDVVPGAWYVDAVNYVVANGLMEGTSATTFEPEARMTRAMFWTILARIDGETITGSTWADDARAWAMANGVSDGTNPHSPLTREQLVTMLHRYLGEPATTGSLSTFTDANAVSAWAKTAMAWAIEKGIITGVTTTTLAPQSAATRAQCATILMRNAL